MIHPYYTSSSKDFTIAQGDSFKLLKEFDFKFDMIFADPPYFLSNGGISLQSGKVVCVDKGDWDKGKSQADMMAFNMVAKTEHSHPLGMVVSTHFRCGKGVKRGLKNGALPFNID